MAAVKDLQSTSKPCLDDAMVVDETDDHSMAEGWLPMDREPIPNASGALDGRAGARRARATDFY